MSVRGSVPERTGVGGSTNAVLVASRALVGIAARSLAAVEDTVTLVQYRTLVLLSSRGEMNVGSLADALGLHQSTATRLCDRLVNKGLVERSHPAESRREVFVALTPDGEGLVRAVNMRRRGEIGRIMGRMAPARRVRYWPTRSASSLPRPESCPTTAWKLGWTT